MAIELGDKWVLDADQYNYILRQHVTRERKETGEKYDDLETVSFHRTLDQVAVAVGRSTARKAILSSCTLDAVVVALEGAVTAITAQLNQLPSDLVSGPR